MARKRSEQELWDLGVYANKRVLQGRGDLLSKKVADKALSAAARIERTKSYRKMANKADFARREVDRYNYAQRAMNRKYAPSTYLGTANG